MSKTVYLLAATALVAAFHQPASAQARTPKRLADHPAVAVQRLHAQAGYDYASKFYPHPAWLYLHAAPPQGDLAAAPAGAPQGPQRVAAAAEVARSPFDLE